jgi:hypothetical protein
VPELLAHRPPFGEQVGREQPLRQVVDAAVPLAPRDPQDSGLGQRLEDRPDLVRRAPVPVDRLARLDVRGGQRAVLADPADELLDERGVLVERAAFVDPARAVPRDPIPRQLRRRHDREHLVERLEQRPLLVQERVGPFPAVAGDPGEQHEVVVPPGDVDRVELDRP